ncbi:WecB/TagA/CpsF family glycosyltransferase [Desulfotomaculum copahuensis]|uniref:N-acetylglucosaminyldiphosphoundecaprenol N-acetyl-beta-D-mannosaminyltransferase n=1 Tax=Desulfotomaculum copahuensis TaxID=1838280 RepID=A0A1B7LBD6_9FIRM|nr:WecB/TagA/CpsF family glycosyltransferase [Desulfotomaculum copahuensis]OAT79821.1 N-acetylmannosaminyltransferase [Desulfotomaculum copahuensis]
MRINLLGAPVDALDLEAAVERVAAFVTAAGPPRQVITLNPEILFRARQEPALLTLINSADLVTADGVGIVWAARMAGTPVPERVTGIDLMLRLMPLAAREGWRVFLLGAAPGVAAEAARRLQAQHPGLVIAGTHHGYFQPGASSPGAAAEPGQLTEDEVAALVRRARPHLLFAGLGAPKQERFIARHKEAMGVPVSMGVGGSFDVLAGRVRRAPRWLQRMHLEWLGRLFMEPARWRRTLVLPRFAWLVLSHVRAKN